MRTMGGKSSAAHPPFFAFAASSSAGDSKSFDAEYIERISVHSLSFSTSMRDTLESTCH